MNLRMVHALLILLSAALAVLFGIWCLSVYSLEHSAATLIAVPFIPVGAGVWRRPTIETMTPCGVWKRGEQT